MVNSVTIKRKRIIGISLAALTIIVVYFAPAPEALSMNGKNTLGILLCGLILWITEAVPIAVTALLLMILLPILGIESMGTTIKTFISPVIFFVIATFGVSIAVLKTPLASRLAAWLLKICGGKSEQTILAFMIGTAALSGIVSNVPVTVLFMSLAIGIIKLSETSGRKLTAYSKCIMIAIPFSAMIGGMTTPAGSSINILALYLLKDYAGIQISFVEWMAFGIPVCIVMLPISWFLLIRMFKPEAIKKDAAQNICAGFPEKLTLEEKKLIIVTGVMTALWVASSWIPAIDITLVAMAGLIAYFIPGIDLLEWNELTEGVSWETIIMVGGVTSIGAAVVKTGLGKWFVEQSLLGFSGWNILLLTMAVGMLVNLLHLILPIAPAIVAVVIPPLIELSIQTNIHPAIFTITTAFLAGCCMLIPLDAVPLITFSKRYYTMWDMFKVGSITSVFWVVFTGLWVPWIANFIY